MSMPVVVAVLTVALILVRLYFLSMRERTFKSYLTFGLVWMVPVVVFVGVLEIFLISVPFGSTLFWLFMIPVWICAVRVKRWSRREARRLLFRRGILQVPPGAEMVPDGKLAVLVIVAENQATSVSKFRVFEPGDLVPERLPEVPPRVSISLERLASGEEMHAVGKRSFFGRHGEFKITNRNGTPKIKWVKAQPEQA